MISSLITASAVLACLTPGLYILMGLVAVYILLRLFY